MTTVKGQLLLMLETVANALGDDLRKRLVFVGGCTTALFITDEVVLESVRATDDVDLIVDLVGRAQWAQRVARMSAAICGDGPSPGCRCAHPGYACCGEFRHRIFQLIKRIMQTHSEGLWHLIMIGERFEQVCNIWVSTEKRHIRSKIWLVIRGECHL